MRGLEIGAQLLDERGEEPIKALADLRSKLRFHRVLTRQSISSIIRNSLECFRDCVIFILKHV